MTNSDFKLILALAVIFLLMVVGPILACAYQAVKLRALHRTKIEPKSYKIFKGLTWETWYLSRDQSTRIRDIFRPGKIKIFRLNEQEIGLITRQNKLASTLDTDDRKIIAKPELQTFTNVLNKLEFIDTSTNTVLLTVRPLEKGVRFSIDHSFSIENTTFSLKSLPLSKAGNTPAADIFKHGKNIGRISQPSFVPFDLMVLSEDISPSAVLLIFDLFQRYAR